MKNVMFERDLYDLMVVADHIQEDIPRLPIPPENAEVLRHYAVALGHIYSLLDKEYQLAEKIMDELLKENRQ